MALENEEKVWWMADEEGDRSGPFSWNEVVARPENTLVWRENYGSEWVHIHQLQVREREKNTNLFSSFDS